MVNRNPSRLTVSLAIGVVLATSGCSISPPGPPRGPAEATAHRDALRGAVMAQDPIRLHSLLARGGPLDADALLVLAAERGNVSLVRMLLDHGADPNTGANGIHETPLMAAARVDSDVVAEALLVAGADPNGRAGPLQCCTALTNAVGNRHVSLVGQLLAAGADPNTRVGDFSHARSYDPRTSPTVLMVAASLGDALTVEFLLQRGADPSLVDADGRTARDWLKTYECPAEKIDGLLRRGPTE